MTAELLTDSAFLTIDEQPITPQQVVRYLQAGRKLEGFLGEILKQFVLERELQQAEIAPNSAQIEQAVIDFRLQQQLTDPQRFQEWLRSNAMTYESFHRQVAQSFQLQELKTSVTADQLGDYFSERKLQLDRMILSRIVVAEKELADELKSQLAEGASFESLAREYSLMDDRMMNGMVGPVSLGTIPEDLRALMLAAQPGDVVGPVGMEARWGLFRVEAFLPASLDDPQLVQTLQEELFERWLAERMQRLPIRIQVGNDS